MARWREIVNPQLCCLTNEGRPASPDGHDDQEQKNEERISAFRGEDTSRALKAR
jgi:hypothetical protein